MADDVRHVAAEERARLKPDHMTDTAGTWCHACDRAVPCDVLRLIATCDELEGRAERAETALRQIVGFVGGAWEHFWPIAGCEVEVRAMLHDVARAAKTALAEATSDA